MGPSMSWDNSETGWSEQMNADPNTVAHDHEDYFSNSFYYEQEMQSIPGNMFHSPNVDLHFQESSYGAQNMRSEGPNFHMNSEYFADHIESHKQVHASHSVVPGSSHEFYDAENISPSSTIHHSDTIVNFGNTKVVHHHVEEKSNLIQPSHSEWDRFQHRQHSQLRPQSTAFASQSQTVFQSGIPEPNFGGVGSQELNSRMNNRIQPNIEMTNSYRPDLNFPGSLPPNSHPPNFASDTVDVNQLPRASNVLPTSVQHDKPFQTQNIQASLPNPNDPDTEDLENDEDMSRTLALLQKQGISDENIFDNQYSSQTVQSEQNIAHTSYSIQPDPSQSNSLERNFVNTGNEPIMGSGTKMYQESGFSQPSADSKTDIMGSGTNMRQESAFSQPSADSKIDIMSSRTNIHQESEIPQKPLTESERDIVDLRTNMLQESQIPQKPLMDAEKDTISSTTSMNQESQVPPKPLVDAESETFNQDSVNALESDDEDIEDDENLEIGDEQEAQDNDENQDSERTEVIFPEDPIPDNSIPPEENPYSGLNSFLSDEQNLLKEKHSELEKLEVTENGSIEETGSHDAKLQPNSEQSTYKKPESNYNSEIDSEGKTDSLVDTAKNLPFSEDLKPEVSEIADGRNNVDSKAYPDLHEKLTDHEQEILTDTMNETSSKDVQTESEHVSDTTNAFVKQNIFETKNDTAPSSISEHSSDFENLLSIPESEDISSDGSQNLYQKRNLKGDIKSDTDIDPDGEENSTDSGTTENYTFENGLEALRCFVESILLWVPEPFYSFLMDLDQKGIPHRVPVFTALSAVPCVLLIIAIVFIKEKSKENKLSAQLIAVEKNAYTLSAEKNILEEKLEVTNAELKKLETALNDEKNTVTTLFKEIECLKEKNKVTSNELLNRLDELEMLRQKENEYIALLEDFDKEKTELQENKDTNENKLQDLEDSIARLNDILQENESEINELKKERLELLQYKEDREEKLAQLQQNCNQLLKEAEVWNLRVSELNEKLTQESVLNKELEANLATSHEEIESLKNLVETFHSFDNMENSEMETQNSKEEKMQYLLNSSTVLIKLQKQQEENTLLIEKLETEKKQILDMEVEMLDAKSEIDKLKLSYNQALQDKAEAQTKLEVLTNYFKDKEIQLQKQLGAQEAVRQKKEEDASSAERRITLIEQENASYKYQVASMKQEMEETERNLKTQIAAQEKKAHENWIAARAAERKLEDVKQEVTQLRQRLTILEREQENWANAPQDDILRPVPKRIPPMNDNSGPQDINNSSMDMRPPWPPLPLDRIPPPPMMLPADRPLPPLPPPPMHPFLPLEPHFRPPPWHLPPESSHGSDFRVTPPEFLRARESTPPRGRQSNYIEGEAAPNSSPLGTDTTRDSRNSTPPHSLPDFHDIPPQPPRPYFPHPGPISRFPPPFRRDLGPKRIDNQDDFSSVSQGSQQPPEHWQHSNTRV
ncbi:transport and Golgi organization protein 1 homolog [Uloborus diversus]|uniref:transport and Golgi organization protein 1 homolog n=1 Tax=Uloborus diversus TaxID=327109 RepID=UPI00240A6311|nr:transport and Golgi organization protein 1 homolog [Uloborus diversus]